MKRSWPFAAWLALALVAVQAAALAHQHAEPGAPAAPAGQVCDLCTATQATAPAPDPPAATGLCPVDLGAVASPRVVPPAARPSRAHRCRAPPSFRSR